MNRIEDILKALGLVGAPESASKTIEIAKGMDKDAQDGHVETKTQGNEVLELLKSLAIVVAENSKAIDGAVAKVAGFEVQIARVEETLTKSMAQKPVIETAPDEEQLGELQKTASAVTSAKSGMPPLKLSPSGAVIRPRVQVPDTMIGGK